MSYFVCLRASKRNGRLFADVTGDLRHLPHRRSGLLVWYESHDALKDAKARQKRIRGWARACKIGLIEKANSDWRDLALPGT